MAQSSLWTLSHSHKTCPHETLSHSHKTWSHETSSHPHKTWSHSQCDEILFHSHMWHGLSHHHRHYHIHLRHGPMRHHLIHITYFNTRDTSSWDIRQRCPGIEAALDPRGVYSIDSFAYIKLFSCFVPCLTFDHGKVTCTAVPTLCLPIDVIYIIEIDCI